MDEILLAFVKDNMVTIGLILAVLKIIAQETPWAVDDKILAIFTGFFGRNSGKN